MASEMDFKKATADLIKAVNENTNTQGGFLVPEVWGQKLYELIVAKSTAIQLCEQITMTSDTLYFPKVTSANTAYFVSEAVTITASQPAFTQITLNPKKIAALTQLSSEVMEDSNPSVIGVLMQRLAEDIALKVDYEIYNGTTTTGGFVGFRSVTDAATAVDVNGELSTDNISDAISALQCGNIEPTDLVIHPKLMNKLRKLKVSTTSNEPLLNMVNFGNVPLTTGQIGKVWGINVIVTTQLPIDLTNATGASGFTTALTAAVLVARGKCGVFARRREMQINKFYLIDTDDWKLQANMRAAFSSNYGAAICIIKNIGSA